MSANSVTFSPFMSVLHFFKFALHFYFLFMTSLSWFCLFMGSPSLNCLNKVPADFNLTHRIYTSHSLHLEKKSSLPFWIHKIHTTKQKLQDWESGVTEFQTFIKEGGLPRFTHHYKALLQRIQLSSLVQECGKLVTCIFCCSVYISFL